MQLREVLRQSTLSVRAGILVLVTSFVLILSSNMATAQSQPKSGLAISPPTFELSANPGDTLKNSLRVDNVVNEPLEVTVETRNFSALGEEGGIDLSPSDGAFALASWISVAPAKVTIPAGESKVFEFTTAIPQNASPGGRFGSIIFKTTIKPLNGQSGVAVGQEIGALVFLKISGQVKEKASIETFGARSGLNEQGPVGFDLRVKNEGNIQFKPSGTITISNFLGRKVASIPVTGQNVLPGAVRKMSGEWDNKWLFGRYTATTSLVYGNDKQIIVASTAFWGFPYKTMGIILFFLLMAGVVIYPRRKRISRAVKVLFGKE
jgi:hypothetical protein